MALARKTFPRGTQVQIRLVLPKTHGGRFDGFAWNAPRDVSAAELLDGVRKQLIPKATREWLDLDID